MRRSVPDGDLAALIEVVVTEKLESLEARRFAQTDAPRKTVADVDTTPRSREIPAPVRREVYRRDGGRCTYTDSAGRRCPERGDLEYHHRDPFARGGDHAVANILLACRPHNLLFAELDYGRALIDRHRSRPPEARV